MYFQNIVKANRQLSARRVYDEVNSDPIIDLRITTESSIQDLTEKYVGLEEVVDYLELHSKASVHLSNCQKLQITSVSTSYYIHFRVSNIIQNRSYW